MVLLLNLLPKKIVYNFKYEWALLLDRVNFRSILLTLISASFGIITTFSGVVDFFVGENAVFTARHLSFLGKDKQTIARNVKIISFAIVVFSSVLFPLNTLAENSDRNEERDQIVNDSLLPYLKIQIKKLFEEDDIRNLIQGQQQNQFRTFLIMPIQEGFLNWTFKIITFVNTSTQNLDQIIVQEFELDFDEAFLAEAFSKINFQRNYTSILSSQIKPTQNADNKIKSQDREDKFNRLFSNSVKMSLFPIFNEELVIGFFIIETFDNNFAQILEAHIAQANPTDLDNKIVAWSIQREKTINLIWKSKRILKG